MINQSGESLANPSKREVPLILCVDDEDAVRTLLCQVLVGHSYSVIEANQGNAALTRFREHAPDLVLLDVMMPDKDGFAVCAETRALPHGQTTPILMLTGLDDVASINRAFEAGATDFITKPINWALLAHRVRYALRTASIEVSLRETMAELEDAHTSLKKSYVSAVKVFSNLIELREGAFAGHSRRVADQARKLALRLGVNSEESQQVFIAGLLHDIGKIGLPDEIINKPYKALTPSERKSFHKHPIVGETSLMALEPLHDAAKIIRAHHEQYNGKGYPDGLEKQGIPLGARVLAVVNDYESHKSGGHSKAHSSHRDAVEFIRRNRGNRYDPVVVDEFLELLGTGEIGDKEEYNTAMSNGLKEGMVIAKDMVNQDGVLLLAEGQVLTQRLIAKIQEFEMASGEDLEILVRKAR